MNASKPTGELLNPKVGDSVVSKCGIIKVTIASNGSLPITKLITNEKGSFKIQLYYAGKQDPDTVVFRTDDPPVPPYRLDSSVKLLEIKDCDQSRLGFHPNALCSGSIQVPPTATLIILWPDLEDHAMAKRKLRLLKRIPPIIGVCEACLAQFKSVFTGPMAAQTEIRVRYAAHKCMATDRTARIQKAA